MNVHKHKHTQKRKHSQLHIFTRALVTAALPLLLLSVLFTSTASAWFYFPASENVTIESAPAVPFQMNVYKLDGTTGAALVTSSTDTTVNLNLSMNFFQWIDQYFCEEDAEQYFALEFIYDSDALFASTDQLRLKSKFDVECAYIGYNKGMDDASTSFFTDGSGKYVCFPFYTVSYAFGNNADIRFDTFAAYHEARAVTYSDLIDKDCIAAKPTTYSDVPKNVAQATITCNNRDDAGNGDERALTDLDYNAFRQQTQTGERLRLIVYIKIEAQENDLTERLHNVDLNNEIELYLQSQMTLDITFQTIPAYTGN